MLYICPSNNLQMPWRNRGIGCCEGYCVWSIVLDLVMNNENDEVFVEKHRMELSTEEQFIMKRP